jgi:hypothetical protein
LTPTTIGQLSDAALSSYPLAQPTAPGTVLQSFGAYSDNGVPVIRPDPTALAILDASTPSLHTDLTISADKKTAFANTYYNCHVRGMYGFQKVKAKWSFKLTKDTPNDEAVCLGMMNDEATNGSYDTNGHYTVKAMTGQVYENGNGGRTDDNLKYHPNDVIEFLFDGVAGTVEMAINGVHKGVVFSGFDTGKTWYPAVCFYYSNREVQFLACEEVKPPLDGVGDFAAFNPMSTVARLLSSLTSRAVFEAVAAMHAQAHGGSRQASGNSGEQFAVAAQIRVVTFQIIKCAAS